MDLDKVIESVGENTEENRMKHKRILMEHYALKGLQWGGFAGLVGLPPYYYFYKRYYFFHIFSRLNTTAGLAGVSFSTFCIFNIVTTFCVSYLLDLPY